MGKHKLAITFDTQFLNQLKDDENNCVEVITRTQHLALHPYQLEKLGSSIKDTLNRGIAKYNKQLHGILLGYHNVKLIGDTGAINFDSCFLHVDVQAEFYTFKPDVGRQLTGIINKKSTDHIGVLVHNTFNVSLPKPSDAEDWLGDRAQIGNEVLFQITFTDLQLRLPYIKGKILKVHETDSGISTGDETITTKKKKKLNKVIKFDEDDTPKTSKKRKLESSIEETPKRKKSKYSSPEQTPESMKVSKKKKKKAKTTDDGLPLEGVSSVDSPAIEETPKIKKRKGSVGESNDLDSLRNSLLQQQMSLLEAEDGPKPKKNKKQKKEKRKKHKDDDEVSLPDLNLNELFSSSVSKSLDKVDMADSSDKSTRKRRKSVSQASFNFELPEDLDLDVTGGKKRKRSSSESHSASKRKRKNSLVV